MFGTLGGPEVILILVVALIVFGPRRLPEIGKSMGKMLAEFRKASNDFRQTIENEVEADKLRTELAEEAARNPAPPTAPVEPAAEAASAHTPGAEAAPTAAPHDAAAPTQMADGQAPAAPETHAVTDATPAPAALHPPVESVSRE